MTPGFNGTQAIQDVVAGGGVPYTSVLATGPARFLQIVESDKTAEGAANVPQGLEYALPNDGFTTWFDVQPASAGDSPMGQPIEIGDPQALRGPHGIVLGNGPDTPGAGTPPIPVTELCRLRSLSATPTAVIVKQIY